MRLRVFYSWQSDRSAATNRDFIGRCLDVAAARLNADASLRIEASVDSDTRDVSGAPAISETVLGKIVGADAYVFDLSVVGKYGDKCVPNPNVVLELGVAVGVKGWERIVLLMNDAFGRPEQLPFDLRHRRIATYTQTGKGESTEAPLASLLEAQLRDVAAYLLRAPGVAEITKDMVTLEQQKLLQWLAREEPRAVVLQGIVTNLGLSESVAVSYVGRLFDYGLLDVSMVTREGPRFRLSDRGRRFVEREALV